jgi:hypothetical protein
MGHRLFVSVMAGFVCAAAWASEPGQPLDCSDWNFSQAGFSCEQFPEPPFGAGNHFGTTVAHVDNDGRFITVWLHFNGSLRCGGVNTDDFRIEVYWTDLVTGEQIPIASTSNRCGISGSLVDGLCADSQTPDQPEVNWDPVNGALWIKFCSYGSSSLPYVRTTTSLRLSGFTSLYDVQQTFVPRGTSLTFRVPPMPEGMAAADHFDTYWGDLSTVGNWSQAHGLQCHYPAAAPARGDYLTVPDTLSAPQPGHGYYYVTAATYQGQIRYGRKTAAGHVTGRDPALLPACTTEAQR